MNTAVVAQIFRRWPRFAIEIIPYKITAGTDLADRQFNFDIIDALQSDQPRGMVAFELLDLHRPRKTIDMIAHPRCQRVFVERVALANRRRPEVFVRAYAHPAWLFRKSRFTFLARLHLCTSVGPS